MPSFIFFLWVVSPQLNFVLKIVIFIFLSHNLDLKKLKPLLTDYYELVFCLDLLLSLRGWFKSRLES